MFDTTKDVNERQEDLLSLVQFSRENSFVLVGHSHYFRALLRRIAIGKWRDNNPEFAKDLGTCILTNGGVIACDVDFSEAAPRIVAASLLFDSGLIVKGIRRCQC